MVFEEAWFIVTDAGTSKERYWHGDKLAFVPFREATPYTTKQAAAHDQRDVPQDISTEIVQQRIPEDDHADDDDLG